jgi:hypothetical protein
VLKNQERNLGIRRRSSRSEVEYYFQLLEWPAEVRRGWRPISSPHIFMTVESVRTSDISDLEMICAMRDSNWLTFGWVGCISRGVQPFLNPMKIEQIRSIRYI